MIIYTLYIMVIHYDYIILYIHGITWCTYTAEANLAYYVWAPLLKCMFDSQTCTLPVMEFVPLLSLPAPCKKMHTAR